jgi:hypothetical protein
MTDKEKLHSGKVYYPSGEEIMTEQLGYLDKLYDFNMTRPSQLPLREKLLKEMFAEIGENCYIEPPYTQIGVDTTCILATMCMQTLGLQWLMIPTFT